MAAVIALQRVIAALAVDPPQDNFVRLKKFRNVVKFPQDGAPILRSRGPRGGCAQRAILLNDWSKAGPTRADCLGN